MTLPYLVIQTLCLPARVLLLRLLSLAIASLVIPLGYVIAKQALPNRSMAVLIPVLLTSLPGLFIDVCRVGNESLAIVLTSAVILCSLHVLRPDAGLREWLILGAFLGAALLTKAYALAFLPVLPLLAGLRIYKFRATRKETVVGILFASILVGAIAGWWYWRCWMLTGTLSGEQIDSVAARFTLHEKLAAVFAMNWLTVIDAAAFSHIWVGAWSFLVVRSWMYRIFELAAALAGAGLMLFIVRITSRIGRGPPALGRTGQYFIVVATVYILLCMGLGYHALVTFLVKGISTSLGWYLYSVIVAEVVLIALGMTCLFGTLWAQRTVAALCVFSIALDLYTVNFFLAPYYTGLIRHTASGSLNAFHIEALGGINGIEEIVRRLSINEATSIEPGTIACLWFAYLCATTALITVSVILAAKQQRTPPPNRP
jgi:hypothetical protein